MQKKVKPDIICWHILVFVKLSFTTVILREFRNSAEKMFLFAQFISFSHYDIGNVSRCGCLFGFNEVY